MNPPAESPPSLRARVFAVSDELVTRATRAFALVHQGLWLGMLDGRALNEVTQQYYRTSARYVDPDYVASGLKPWETDAIARHFEGCRSVLVGAAGSGREIVALAGRGLEVTAFDCSAPCVEQGRRLLAARGLSARLLLADPDEVPEGLGIFDGVIMGWGGYTHVAGRARRVALLASLRRHVRPGAPLLVSFLTREASGPSRFYRGLAALARTVRWLRRSREPIEPGDVLAHAFFHRFTRSEIEAELREGGFRLLSYADVEYGVAVARAGDDAGVRGAG